MLGETKVLDKEPIMEGKTSKKSYTTALLLCFFLGTLGAHRFYAGKIASGILMVLTMGGLGIWYTIDMVIIILGKMRDKHGLYIRHRECSLEEKKEGVF